MTLFEIRSIPVTFETRTGSKIHESVMRSYHIAEKIIQLVRLGTPKEVIIEIWEDLKTAK